MQVYRVNYLPKLRFACVSFIEKAIPEFTAASWQVKQGQIFHSVLKTIKHVLFANVNKLLVLY